MKFIAASRIPTHPSSELWAVLESFIDEIVAELNANHAGIYLIGSLATGDFDQ